ncbi:MAG: hypothetical protein IKL88_08755 [Erysipelotrichales bacterium]|nr:hypothetical protein [Erysipelotrichales bacterium]
MWITDITLLILFILSFFQMNIIIEVSRQVLQTFLITIFPSLFFMLVLCKLLLQSGMLQRVLQRSSLHYALYLYALLGIIIGFAGNALLLKDAYHHDQITSREVQIITLCCCIPSFPFCIFTLGSLLGDMRYGVLLYATQCIFACVMLSFYIPSTKLSLKENTALSLQEALQSSGNGLYMMLGYILLVSVMLALVTPLLPQYLQEILFYIGEFASASIQTVTSSNTLSTKLYTLSIILGFGSLNAHLQIYAITPVVPKYSTFLLYRILQMLFSISILYLFLKLLH